MLAINHVLAAHPLACERLKPHAGKRITIAVANWRLPLGAPDPWHVAITPAGLLERDDRAGASGVDLTLTADAGQPWKTLDRWVAGELPPVDIQGDAALAGEVSWVLANVRWDAAGDVERLFGPIVADVAQRVGSAAVTAGQALIQGARTLGDRLRPR